MFSPTRLLNNTPMLDTKKPSERIDDYFYPRTRLEMTDVENIFLDILDEQHQAIQDLEARVEGIKKWITHSHSC